jgi:transcriptional regulator
MSLYVPQAFSTADRDAVAALIDEHPFATLITPATPEPCVSHLPLVLVRDASPHGTLLGHFARANPHSRQGRDVASIAIFHGPHAYVSPSWYREPAQAVPTWNYAAVHAHGALEIVDDPAVTRGILDTLIRRFEGGRPAPWRFTMPEPQRDAFIAAIVAFRLRIDRLEAKFKLSQNRDRADRVRVIAALRNEGRADAAATAAWMHAHADPGGADDEPQ